MTTIKTFTTGTRILLFVSSLYVTSGSVAFLLHIPAVRLAFAVVLLLIGVGVLLAAYAWILHKLWSMSGKVAITLMQKERDSQKARLSTGERENEAQA